MQDVGLAWRLEPGTCDGHHIAIPLKTTAATEALYVSNPMTSTSFHTKHQALQSHLHQQSPIRCPRNHRFFRASKVSRVRKS